MGAKTHRGLVVVAVVVLILGGLFWLARPTEPDAQQPSPVRSGDIAVLPSDSGTDDPLETALPSPLTGAAPPGTTNDASPEATDDPSGAEQVARAFMTTYPGDVHALADPTFLASLDGVDASLLDQISHLDLEQTDHATGELYEQYAFTITGTYQGEPAPIYTVVVARPIEPGEGGSTAENDLPFQVQSFDWAPDMLGDEHNPGPAAGLRSPITAEQRATLPNQIRTDVITPVLTVHPGESPEQRRTRLDALSIEPITEMPPMSRSGRYAMTTEILTQAYSTAPGGPITITYTGTWVDPYDPTHNGSWALTATITRDDDGRFRVRNVAATVPVEDNGHDE